MYIIEAIVDYYYYTIPPNRGSISLRRRRCIIYRMSFIITYTRDQNRMETLYPCNIKASLCVRAYKHNIIY